MRVFVYRLFAFLLIDFLIVSSTCGAGLQLKNLGQTSSSRFTVEDRQWPQNYGEYDICMWKDDKLAAFSVTIDDNMAIDHSYWQQLSSQYGWKWAWFIITGRVGVSPTWNGSWSTWQGLFDAGHDIQSHSWHHQADSSISVDDEYGVSKNMINSSIVGGNCLTFAYPNGSHVGNNNPTIASQHYLSSRDVLGTIDDPSKINYNRVHCIGNVQNFFQPNSHWGSFNGAITPGNYKFRTWYVALFHQLSTSRKQDLVSALDHVKQNEDDIWVARYTDAAKYGQEFATATMTNLVVDSNEISFDIEDDMYDRWFDFPLTIKVNIDTWNGLTASQDGNTIPYKVVNKNNHQYVLVEVVPDGGKVILKASSTTPVPPVNYTDSCEGVTFNLTLDNFGTETTWILGDSVGNVILQGGPYQNKLGGTVVTIPACLDTGKCYNFIIKDSGNDGLATLCEKGSYEMILDSTGAVLFSGDDFGDYKIHQFCVEGKKIAPPPPVKPPCNDRQIIVELKLDNKGSEVSWEFVDDNGQIQVSGSGYPDNQNGFVVLDTVCLPEGCYTFNIYDSAGNGLCCSDGSGYFKIKNFMGGTFAYGNKYANKATRKICVNKYNTFVPTHNLLFVPNDSEVSANYEQKEGMSLLSEPIVTPTQSRDNFTLFIPNYSSYNMYNATVFAIDGKKVAEIKINAEQTMFDIQGEKPGLYVVKINDGKRVATQRIVLM